MLAVMACANAVALPATRFVEHKLMQYALCLQKSCQCRSCGYIPLTEEVLMASAAAFASPTASAFAIAWAVSAIPGETVVTGV